MAFDEAVLERHPLEEPLFYLWQNRPAVIIGRNQSAYAEVNLPYLREKGIALARRVTGGGAVYHDLGNLNYTIAGRTADLDADLPLYLGMVSNALRSLGVPAEVSGRNDILVGGRKCSGYAKRLSRDRMMIHGTLMFSVDLEELTRALDTPGSKLSAAGVASVRSRVANLSEYLPGWSLEQFREGMHTALASEGSGCDSDGVPGCEAPLPEGFLDGVNELADSKFRSWDWIYGNSPETELCLCRKFPSCGTVEARFSLQHGRIRGLRFTGDFLGALPADGIESALEGCRYAPEALASQLETLPVSRCFDGLDPAGLLSLFTDNQ